MIVERRRTTDPVGTPPDGFGYVPEFLSPTDHASLMGVLETLTYDHDVFRGNPFKRGYAQFGYSYVTNGRRLIPAPPIPDDLTTVATAALAHCPVGTQFDQCIVTKYPADAGIGWHVDAPVFGDCIAAVSLSAPARLQFSPKGQKEVSHEVLAAPGSLYVMRGPARWEYQHQVKPVKTERFSITFRSVKERQVIS